MNVTLNPSAPPKSGPCSRALCVGHAPGAVVQVSVIAGDMCFYGYVCSDPTCVALSRRGDGVYFTYFGNGYGFTEEKLEAARQFIRDFDLAAWEVIPFAVVCGSSFCQRFDSLGEATDLAIPMWFSYNHQVEVLDSQGARVWPAADSFAAEQAARERDNQRSR